MFRLSGIPDLTELSLTPVAMETDSSPSSSDGHTKQSRSVSCKSIEFESSFTSLSSCFF